MRTATRMAAAVAFAAAASFTPAAAGLGVGDGGVQATAITARFAFVPSTIVMVAGSDLTLSNLDLAAHSLTSTATDPVTGEPIFDSGMVGTGATATVAGAAALPGGGVSYTFFCWLHSGMRGTLVVV